MAVEDLLRGRRRVRYDPMVHRGIGNDAYCGLGNPPPENDVFVALVGLDFLLRVDIENLKSLVRCCRF